MPTVDSHQVHHSICDLHRFMWIVVDMVSFLYRFNATGHVLDPISGLKINLFDFTIHPLARKLVVLTNDLSQ
jgi:hypothetical protein